MSTDTNQPLADLTAAGVSLWLDDLSRDRITSGNLAELITSKHISGVTTNPSIFAAALSKGEAYDPQVAELAKQGSTLDDTIRTLTTDDVRNAADLFKGVFEASGGIDGRVSIEVEPGIARDSVKTSAQAQELYKIVDRPNLLVKIPATVEGLSSITETLKGGISVNVTLIFSLERYEAVIDAYIEGVEAGQGQRRGHLQAALGGLVLRLPRRRRDRQAPGRHRHRRGHGPQGQGRDRQRPAGLPAVRAEVRVRRVESARVRRRQQAAAAVGLHRRQGPGLRRHPLRRRARRPRVGQHRPREDHRRRRRPRRGPRRHRPRHLRGVGAGLRRPRPPSASTSTTSSPSWRPKASTSSSSPGTSSSRPSAPPSPKRPPAPDPTAPPGGPAIFPPGHRQLHPRRAAALCRGPSGPTREDTPDPPCR